MSFLGVSKRLGFLGVAEKMRLGKAAEVEVLELGAKGTSNMRLW